MLQTARVLTHPVPLIPKLRGHFAEFLHHDYLDRLGILYLSTCVGLGYGRLDNTHEAFLGSIGSPSHRPKSAPRRVSGTRVADLPTTRPTRLARDNHRPGWATFLRPSAAYLLGTWIVESVTSVRRPPPPPVLSIIPFSIGSSSPVREYQPVVHRLRLSASP